MTSRPILIACAHGTRSQAGQAVMAAWQQELVTARADLTVLAAHLDVQEPTLDEVAARVRQEGGSAVVVPLLLSTGYHVRVDVARAVEAMDGRAVAAASLGPDPVLVELLQERLGSAGAGPDDAIVLASAGSSDPGAVADIEATAAELARERGVPVYCGYLSAARPTVPEAIAAARAELPGLPVSVATYLLAPGHFATVLGDAGADHVSAPLAPAPSLTRLVLDRFERAASALPA